MQPLMARKWSESWGIFWGINFRPIRAKRVSCQGDWVKSRSESRHQTGSLTVIIDRWLDSQHAWPSVYSTPRKRVLGLPSNVPQSLMMVISNNYTNNLKQFLKKTQIRRIQFFRTWPVWVWWWFVHHIHIVNVAVNISVTSRLTPR